MAPVTYADRVASRKKRPRSADPLEPYRRIRKPMPPPERVLPDKRRKLEEKLAEREGNEREAEEAG